MLLISVIFEELEICEKDFREGDGKKVGFWTERGPGCVEVLEEFVAEDPLAGGVY